MLDPFLIPIVIIGSKYEVFQVFSLKLFIIFVSSLNHAAADPERPPHPGRGPPWGFREINFWPTFA